MVRVLALAVLVEGGRVMAETLEERLRRLKASAYGRNAPIASILNALTDEEMMLTFDDLLETLLQEGRELSDVVRGDLWGKTGILVRMNVGGKWDGYDIADPRVSDEQVVKWLRSRGEKNEWAEKCVLLLLGREQKSAEVY